MNRTAGWLMIAVILILAPLAAGSADDLKARADAAWAERGDAQKALQAVDLYAQLAAADPADFESRIRVARGTYWVLEELKLEMDKDQKIALYDRAIKGCQEILAKDRNHVGANYWLIWDMAAVTLIRGVFSGFAIKESLVGTIMVSKGDVAYSCGGVYVYWGRVIYETPGLLGKFFRFTDEDSIFLYGEAIKLEPRCLRNHVFLAETYEKMDRTEEARKEYQFCAAQPDDALPELGPENRHYKTMAEERLKNLR